MFVRIFFSWKSLNYIHTTNREPLIIFENAREKKKLNFIKCRKKKSSRISTVLMITIIIIQTCNSTHSNNNKLQYKIETKKGRQIAVNLD